MSLLELKRFYDVLRYLSAMSKILNINAYGTYIKWSRRSGFLAYRSAEMDYKLWNKYNPLKHEEYAHFYSHIKWEIGIDDKKMIIDCTLPMKDCFICYGNVFVLSSSSSFFTYHASSAQGVPNVFRQKNRTSKSSRNVYSFTKQKRDSCGMEIVFITRVAL